MLNTFRAVMREGKIELLEAAGIPEGTEVLVTPLVDDGDFWQRASGPASAAVWDKLEDDVYAKLLKE